VLTTGVKLSSGAVARCEAVGVAQPPSKRIGATNKQLLGFMPFPLATRGYLSKRATALKNRSSWIRYRFVPISSIVRPPKSFKLHRDVQAVAPKISLQVAPVGIPGRLQGNVMSINANHSVESR
jgi:hypothetical protein